MVEGVLLECSCMTSTTTVTLNYSHINGQKSLIMYNTGLLRRCCVKLALIRSCINKLSFYAENCVSLQGEGQEREREQHVCCLKFYLNCSISSIYNTLCQDHLLIEIKINCTSVIITDQNKTAYCRTNQVNKAAQP